LEKKVWEKIIELVIYKIGLALDFIWQIFAKLEGSALKITLIIIFKPKENHLIK